MALVRAHRDESFHLLQDRTSSRSSPSEILQRLEETKRQIELRVTTRVNERYRTCEAACAVVTPAVLCGVIALIQTAKICIERTEHPERVAGDEEYREGVMIGGAATSTFFFGFLKLACYVYRRQLTTDPEAGFVAPENFEVLGDASGMMNLTLEQDPRSVRYFISLVDQGIQGLKSLIKTSIFRQEEKKVEAEDLQNYEGPSP